MITIRLPWPPKELSPNARVHWAKKAKATRHCWAYAFGAAYDSRAKLKGVDGPLDLWLTFNPPDRRKRDDDNLVAMFKGYRDGIAGALNIDDSRFRLHVQRGEPTKGGEVVAVITEGEQQ